MLRPVEPDDREFLYRVYASTRTEELAVVPWDDAQKDAFLRAQFDAQDAWWRENYGGASFDVIVVDGEPAGRLYLHRGDTEIRIVDIALLPEHRGKGVGTAGRRRSWGQTKGTFRWTGRRKAWPRSCARNRS